MCGKTALLLKGTHTEFLYKRISCCSNEYSVFLSTDDRRGKFYWKTTVPFARPLKRLVAQRTTRLTTNQEIEGSNPVRLGDRLFTHMFLVKQNQTTLLTDTKKTPQLNSINCFIIKDVHVVSEMITD